MLKCLYCRGEGVLLCVSGRSLPRRATLLTIAYHTSCKVWCVCVCERGKLCQDETRGRTQSNTAHKDDSVQKDNHAMTSFWMGAWSSKENGSIVLATNLKEVVLTIASNTLFRKHFGDNPLPNPDPYSCFQNSKSIWIWSQIACSQDLPNFLVHYINRLGRGA